ncbi:MAG: hypothetical protein ABSE99_01070 [Terracidiphilus sp.]|jgi:hypothetical protein
MNLTGRPISVAYAVLLAGCATFALRQTQGIMFGMGESGGALGLVAGAFLSVTVISTAALAVAALGSWTRWPVFSLIGIVSAVGVLPAASLYCRQTMDASYWQYNSPWVAAGDILAFVLDIAAVWLSWLRFRQLIRRVN